MTAKLIDGKALSEKLRSEILKTAMCLKVQGVRPGLVVILVGDDEASQVYVENKTKACDELKIQNDEYILPEETTEEELLGLIDRLNHDHDVHGILVQLPLPDHISEEKILEAISPEKDVDGFHPVNMGKLVTGDNVLAPCTPSGIMELIHSTGIEIAGKEAVVIGRSNIVGKPTALMLLHENATVTVCHSKTQNLKEITRRADILVSAVGKAGFVTADMVKPGAVVIDVGMNRNAAGKLCGDVAFDEVSEVAGWITPVPGGVGPMTITMLLKITLTAAQNRRK